MRGVSLGLVLASLLVAPAAVAQAVDDNTRNTARSLAGEGKEAFDAKNYARAVDLFHRAFALVPAPTIALYEAQALVKLGRLVEAEEAYMRAVRTKLDAHASEQFRVAVQDAERELGELQPRIPKATIVVTGPGAAAAELVVELDGKPLQAAVLGVGMPVDPGKHVVLAVADGGEPAIVNFEISEKEQRRLEIQPLPGKPGTNAPARAAPAPVAPPPDTRPPPAPRRTWQKPVAIVAGGVGMAGLATGIVTGLMASSRHATAEQKCPERTCTTGSEGAEALDSFRTLRTVSTIGYIVGGIGLAAGTTLFLTAPTPAPEQAASLRVWISADRVGVLGAF